MRRLWKVHGIATGLVAAAATGGALVGLGLRFGTPARPFNALAAYLLGPAVQALWQFSIVTVVGLLVHVVVSCLCGLAFVALVERSGGGELGWAILVSVVTFGVSWLVAAWLGIGLATLLAIGDRLVLAVVLAASLPLGMRLAFSMARRD